MFSPMIRKKQALDENECVEILKNASSGVLALLGEDGYPYALPMSFALSGNSIYFHCAIRGHKLDCIRNESRASFCVTDRDEVVPQEFTTLYRSVIVFGKMTILLEKEDITHAARALAEKYCPQETAKTVESAIDGAAGRMLALRLDIEHMTGKQAGGLVKK